MVGTEILQDSLVIEPSEEQQTSSVCINLKPTFFPSNIVLQFPRPDKMLASTLPSDLNNI